MREEEGDFRILVWVIGRTKEKWARKNKDKELNAGYVKSKASK